ncbi:hypothetical protein ROHU_014903 [Labeo rohita]|uniref:Uncharacterized protein n=1 Tax=Labeo rohita TaxID=84645 RepID=A0A498NRM0_LABRO|nr:hypothetical protein ROHU_014903 [Labeo rohita]
MLTGNKGRFVPKRESLSLPQPLSPITVSVLIFVGRLFSSPPFAHRPMRRHLPEEKLLRHRVLMPFITKEYQDFMFQENLENWKERDTEFGYSL